MNNKLKYSPTNLRSNASFGSERRSWIIEIHNFLEQEELEQEQEEQEIQVCIFNVPKQLKSTKLESYVPQLLAIGPYHHFHDHLREIERYKVVVTKRAFQTKFPNLKFQELTHQIMKYESKIRACYHKYLEIESETLAMMMALDGLFLLEFLNIYVDMSLSIIASSTKMCHLVNKTGKRFSYDCILRDIFMLENQIPLLVLKKIIHYVDNSTTSSNLSNQIHENVLPKMLSGICKELSPFKLNDDMLPTTLLLQLTNCAHLLDVLYHLIVPKHDDITQDEQLELDLVKQATETSGEIKAIVEKENTEEVFTGIWAIISKSNLFLLSKVCKPLKFIVKLPWKFMRNLPGLSSVTSIITNLLSPTEKSPNNMDNERSKKDVKIGENSLVDEIMVPSVTSLYEAGIEFCISPGDIKTITFDTKTKILYLPIINLDVNSEVVLRNLVAYEATVTISRPLILARYVELMNGIIDTPADAKLLREKKIIVNHLKSDKEVADLWNGMSKTIRLTKVSSLDETIKDINEYYHNTRKVKTHKIMKRFLHGSWEILVLLATIIFLFLMGVDAFCSAYNCPRFFHTNANESD